MFDRIPLGEPTDHELAAELEVGFELCSAGLQTDDCIRPAH